VLEELQALLGTIDDPKGNVCFAFYPPGLDRNVESRRLSLRSKIAFPINWRVQAEGVFCNGTGCTNGRYFDKPG
jgi:hypothetical protein